MEDTKDNCLQLPKPISDVVYSLTCSEGEMILLADLHKVTVGELENVILKEKFNIARPYVTIDDKLIISSEESDEVNLHDKTLAEVGMLSGSNFMVEDYFHNNHFRIKVINQEKPKEKYDIIHEIFGSTDDESGEEIGNQEVLAIKRKDDEAFEDISDAKKSRVD